MTVRTRNIMYHYKHSIVMPKEFFIRRLRRMHTFITSHDSGVQVVYIGLCWIISGYDIAELKYMLTLDEFKQVIIAIRRTQDEDFHSITRWKDLHLFTGTRDQFGWLFSKGSLIYCLLRQFKITSMMAAASYRQLPYKERARYEVICMSSSPSAISNLIPLKGRVD